MRDPERSALRAQKGDWIGIETFDDESPVIRTDDFRNAPRKRGITVEVAFEFNDQRAAIGDHGQKVREGRNGLVRPQQT